MYYMSQSLSEDRRDNHGRDPNPGRLPRASIFARLAVDKVVCEALRCTHPTERLYNCTPRDSTLSGTASATDKEEERRGDKTLPFGVLEIANRNQTQNTRPLEKKNDQRLLPAS